ncbi:MAG: hypothetical protein H6Q73_3677 [Firmicutes bacterium]|nr:hypothetical protein [Bacillota bacterium]
MSKEEEALKTQTLSPEELEALLQTEFGDKLQPVDGVRLAKQRRQQAAMKANRFKFRKS